MGKISHSFSIGLVACILCVFSPHSLSAQNSSIGSWKSYTSTRSVTDITLDSNQNIWASTLGGVVFIDDNSDIEKLTVVDGLSRLDGTSIIIDETRSRVFVGYVDGLIDVINIDDLSVSTLSDIERNTLYSSKTIHGFNIYEHRLLVLTSFGIVEYDLNSLTVTDTYSKIGSNNRGISVYDSFIKNDNLYIGTDSGIAFTPLSGTINESSWTNIKAVDGLTDDPIIALGYIDNEIYASTINSTFVNQNNSWTEVAILAGINVLEHEYDNEDYYIITGPQIFERTGTTNFASTDIFPNRAVSASLDNNSLLVGSLNDGVLIYNTSLEIEAQFVTDGPYQNLFQGVAINDGVLISGSSQKSSFDGNIDKAKGFYIYSDGNWTNENANTNEVIAQFNFQQVLTTTFTDKYYYFGSWGRGIARYDIETSETVIFDETNSTLRGWEADNPLFPVISGLSTDSNVDVWLVSRYATNPLYHQQPGDEDWTPIAKVSEANGLEYESLFIDSFDQKWIPLESTSTNGVGLLVINTNQTLDVSDDTAVRLTTDTYNGNLPDNKVKVIVEDKNNEVWIGTERGIARFLFPEFVIDGSSQERQAQWLINEDTSQVSRFLLRDVNVSAMAVSPSNEKWIGSENQGLWLLNEEGSKILKRFTTENSPLFSNAIISIAVDENTGEVFIATDKGLISYQGISRVSTSAMSELKVYPNPFTYDSHSEIIIDDLSDESTITILGVDGTAIHRFESNSSRTTWDGRNREGRKLGSGVYYIVAVDNDTGKKGIGKVVIIK